ncbi:hypothetical protein [Acinetobacter sp.]|uniref:hypothetical protein n=1 Tax=Acinetobacter sp. TaxID=472 RepID=UPI00388D67EB
MKINELLEGQVIKGAFPKHGKAILKHRRDEGEEWKYWTGVNWFGTKARAAEVSMDKIQALLDKWGFSEKRTPSGEVKVERIENT